MIALITAVVTAPATHRVRSWEGPSAATIYTIAVACRTFGEGKTLGWQLRDDRGSRVAKEEDKPSFHFLLLSQALSGDSWGHHSSTIAFCQYWGDPPLSLDLQSLALAPGSWIR